MKTNFYSHSYSLISGHRPMQAAVPFTFRQIKPIKRLVHSFLIIHGFVVFVEIVWISCDVDISSRTKISCTFQTLVADRYPNLKISRSFLNVWKKFINTKIFQWDSWYKYLPARHPTIADWRTRCDRGGTLGCNRNRTFYCRQYRGFPDTDPKNVPSNNSAEILFLALEPKNNVLDTK